MQPREPRQRWNNVKAQAKQRWDRLTDEDIARVRGSVDRLVDLLGQRYGYARWLAEKEIANWRRTLIRQGS